MKKYLLAKIVPVLIEGMKAQQQMMDKQQGRLTNCKEWWLH